MPINIVAYSDSQRPRRVVAPTEFLAWAKVDIQAGDRRGIANALTNAKRAIHARIGEIVSCLRVADASDWPQHPSTELLLQFLGRADVSIRSVVRLLTGQRNSLEHQYRLPTQDAAKEAVEIAELWLGKSEPHVRPRIMVVGLPTSRFSVSSSSKERRLTVEIRFSGCEPVTFFWDARRRVVSLSASGLVKEAAYNSLTWKDLLRLQLPYVRTREHGYALPAYLAAPIFKAYRRSVLGGGGPIFRISCRYAG